MRSEGFLRAKRAIWSDQGRAVPIDRRIIASEAVVQMVSPVYIYLYCTTDPFGCVPGGPALRANVAGLIGNRVSLANSAFSACMGSGLNSLPGRG